MFLANELAWLIIIWNGRGREDEGFSLIEPILAALFYGIIGLSTILALRCDYWKAIAYYDPVVKQEYLDEMQAAQ